MRNSSLNSRKFFKDVVFVFASQVLEIRHHWFWTCIMMLLLPLAFVAFLVLLGATRPIFIVAGSITHALAIAAGLSLGQRIGGMKDLRLFEYYASLPISKLSFIVALSTNALVSSLPSAIVLLGVGAVFFGFSIRNPLLFIVTLGLAGYSLAGLGAIIGFYSRSGSIASIVTQIVNQIIVFLAPVFIPIEYLPLFLQRISWFFPTTHVARLLRNSLTGCGVGTWESLSVLTVFVIISMLLVHRGLDWRGERSIG